MSPRATLIFDGLILGQANRFTLSRAGIYRYASQLLVALSREGELERILPYCPDPLLAGSMNLELRQLEQRCQVTLQPHPQVCDAADRARIAAANPCWAACWPPAGCPCPGR